jgi:hypothetical protein
MESLFAYDVARAIDLDRAERHVLAIAEKRGLYNDGMTDMRRSTTSVNSCKARAMETA